MNFAPQHKLYTLPLALIWLASCGASTSQLTGRWNLVSLKCNGVVTALPNAMDGFILEYGADSTFTASFDGPGAEAVTVTGTILQNGIEVTENAASATCAIACAFTPYCSGCPGTTALSTSASYRVSLPTTDTLEQYGFSALSFCSGPTTPAQETQIYEKL